MDVQHYRFSIALNDENDRIRGSAGITIRFLPRTDSFNIDLAALNKEGKGMVVITVTENNRSLAFEQQNQLLEIHDTVQTGKSKTYTIQYEGIPADGLIIATNKYGRRTFFADNWPNRAHNWLPCIDHPSDKASVEFLVTAPEHYQVISNGEMVEESNLPNHLRLTHWKTAAELPTKIMVIGAAGFSVAYAGKVSCVPVYSWVYPENKETGFYDYQLAPEILSFFVKQVGPFAYEKLANVQSTTRFGGMENAGAIFYGENTIKGDRRNEALLAHEIAHQWFGDAATETNWQHLWLSEGFATYMTHLYLENKYGTDTLEKRLAEDRKTVIAFSRKRHTPVVDTTVNDNFMQLLNANSYQKGGWVLHMLRRKLGDTIFWQGIRNYFAAYNGRNAATEDFRKIMEAASGTDLKAFFRQWLYVAGQPQLTINWQYDPGKKDIVLTIRQEQPDLFAFPLQVSVQTARGSSTRTIMVKERTMIVTIPSADKPSGIIPDPNLNLLFERL
jgi:aminopeptidase N